MLKAHKKAMPGPLPSAASCLPTPLSQPTFLEHSSLWSGYRPTKLMNVSFDGRVGQVDYTLFAQLGYGGGWGVRTVLFGWSVRGCVNLHLWV